MSDAGSEDHSRSCRASFSQLGKLPGEVVFKDVFMLCHGECNVKVSSLAQLDAVQLISIWWCPGTCISTTLDLSGKHCSSVAEGLLSAIVSSGGQF